MYPNHSNSQILSWTSLILRFVFGALMLLNHGWRKWLKILSDDPIKFADPLGVGELMSLYLTVFAEVLCSALLIIGLFTRGVVVPLLFTMAVAIFMIHWADPFAKKELALIFSTAYILIFILGPGKFSADYILFGSKEKA
jgi:putative oxidoreductase